MNQIKCRLCSNQGTLKRMSINTIIKKLFVERYFDCIHNDKLIKIIMAKNKIRVSIC